MKKVYSRPESLKYVSSTYCPGCLHGVAHNLIAETIDAFGLREKTVAFLPVGCAGLGLYYWNLDNIACSHGRAPAAATGYKRMQPDKTVFTYQGDGDLASIGLAEIMHCANRGEKIITFFANNSVYGMTGGQMAPTTLPGQKTTTSPNGRDVAQTGQPLKMCELISQLDAPVYVARFALNTTKNIIKAKKGIKKAFELNMAGKGYVFIELLSNCPTCWGMSPLESLDWMTENTVKHFPLGVFKDVEGESDNGK
jgi:2-oxoglutarate ferredoxin oxidoreductase subunit beta